MLSAGLVVSVCVLLTATMLSAGLVASVCVCKCVCLCVANSDVTMLSAGVVDHT